MSVWNNIAKAFGFGDDSPEPEEENWQADEAALPVPTVEPSGPVEIDPAQVDAIFQRVVEVFNNALPDFLAKSVDPEKQRKYLYDSLDNSMRNYLADVQQRASDYCATQWQTERDRLKDEAAQLRRHADELEAKKSAMTDKQLSTDRQKRALSERVRDLEEQVVKLEAEKEQLDIENKCMINKAKAASVFEAEIEELRQENVRLNAARQAMDVRSDINDAMGSEFKRQAAEATAEIKALKEKLKSFEDNLAGKEARIADLSHETQIKDTKIAELAQSLQSSKHQAELLQHELDQANSQEDAPTVTAEQLEEIQQQIGRFEEVKNKLDARIEKLRNSLKESQSENQSLRDTIKENLMSAAKTQQEMHSRIEDLSRQLEEAGQSADAAQVSDSAAPAYRRSENKRHGKRSGNKADNSDSNKTVQDSDGIDQLINGADWLVSAPPEESPMHAGTDDTFGYTAPQRKPRMAADNDAQLSLFDL